MSLDIYPIEYYPPERLQEACLIINMGKHDQYNIGTGEYHAPFQRGSNFSQLKYPIVDEFGNIHYDSESRYMSQRVTSLIIKAKIAASSHIKGASKKTAYGYKDLLDTDPNHRIGYMRNSITEKLDNSSWRRKVLCNTGTREIIEFTHWGDDFFGICDKTRTGRNILGKLLMEYRDELLAQIAQYK